MKHSSFMKVYIKGNEQLTWIPQEQQFQLVFQVFLLNCVGNHALAAGTEFIRFKC